MTIGRFSAAVGALLWRPSDGRYLILRRSSDKDYAGGMWECITGRVDQDEGYVEALHREVREELGIAVEIDFVIGTFHFYRGAPEPANEMVGIHFCCSFDEAQVLSLSWEHSEHRWVTPSEADAILPPGHWLLPVIGRAEAIRELSPPGLVAYYRSTSFALQEGSP